MEAKGVAARSREQESTRLTRKSLGAHRQACDTKNNDFGLLRFGPLSVTMQGNFELSNPKSSDKREWENSNRSPTQQSIGYITLYRVACARHYPKWTGELVTGDSWFAVRLTNEVLMYSFDFLGISSDNRHHRRPKRNSNCQPLD